MITYAEGRKRDLEGTKRVCVINQAGKKTMGLVDDALSKVEKTIAHAYNLMERLEIECTTCETPHP